MNIYFSYFGQENARKTTPSLPYCHVNKEVIDDISQYVPIEERASDVNESIHNNSCWHDQAAASDDSSEPMLLSLPMSLDIADVDNQTSPVPRSANWVSYIDHGNVATRSRHISETDTIETTISEPTSPTEISDRIWIKGVNRIKSDSDHANVRTNQIKNTPYIKMEKSRDDDDCKNNFLTLSTLPSSVCNYLPSGELKQTWIEDNINYDENNVANPVNMTECFPASSSTADNSDETYIGANDLPYIVASKLLFPNGDIKVTGQGNPDPEESHIPFQLEEEANCNNGNRDQHKQDTQSPGDLSLEKSYDPKTSGDFSLANSFDPKTSSVTNCPQDYLIPHNGSGYCLHSIFPALSMLTTSSSLDDTNSDQTDICVPDVNGKVILTPMNMDYTKLSDLPLQCNVTNY